MTKIEGPITIHARSTGLTVPAVTAAGDAAAGRVLYQGETITLTAEQVEATYDRTGATWLSLTPEEQTRKWGMQRFGLGEAPAELAENVGADDEGLMYRQGLAAREEALRVSDVGDRVLALKLVQTEYGDALNPIAQGSQYIPPRLTGF